MIIPHFQALEGFFLSAPHDAAVALQLLRKGCRARADTEDADGRQHEGR